MHVPSTVQKHSFVHHGRTQFSEVLGTRSNRCFDLNMKCHRSFGAKLVRGMIEADKTFEKLNYG